MFLCVLSYGLAGLGVKRIYLPLQKLDAINGYSILAQALQGSDRLAFLS